MARPSFHRGRERWFGRCAGVVPRRPIADARGARDGLRTVAERSVDRGRILGGRERHARTSRTVPALRTPSPAPSVHSRSLTGRVRRTDKVRRPCPRVRPRAPAGTLSLLRQGITIELGYGLRALEALLAIAEAVEDAVYESGSLRRIPGGLAFALDNPPLRVGAFDQVKVLIDDGPAAPEAVRLRKGPGTDWRTAADVTAESPFEWRPGERTEFEVILPAPAEEHRICVRVELRSVAIPPIVWCEIREVPVAEVDSG